MRRWLLIFLLLLFPFQLSWAVSAAYCQHERDTQPEHWGHHQDEPNNNTDRTHNAGGAKQDTSTQPNGAVGHCIVSHFGAAQHVDMAAGDAVGALLLPQVLHAKTEDRFISHVSEVPVRPARTLAL
ncbi:hypothetical protein J2W30_003154 [Variovorax boronicumulans]|uniref:hypothetical protein n=1 Tax=Variovorax boronicumulans TaxID=436515 RepID=UPI0027867BB8|nr:hypothetical protein [Variovorax boronicumulans]MDQ0035389.1 hypothetical protein [Variovorax boronicumulans]